MIPRPLEHALTVSRWSGHPVLGMLHDGVEDGWLPQFLCRIWPAMDAISRRKGEVYRDYIVRVSLHPVARAVKLADLEHNMSNAPPGDLYKRYLWAREYLMRSKWNEEAT